MTIIGREEDEREEKRSHDKGRGRRIRAVLLLLLLSLLRDDAPPGEEERGGLKMIENCTPEFFRASSRTIRINPRHSAGAPVRKKGVAILDTRKVIDLFG